MVDNPITRKEKYLAKLTGSYAGNVPDPITRVEKYLYDLCQKGISGLTPEEIENAVNKYLKENPVQPGATTEQAQQIEQNKTDIASLKTETDSLKEDLSNKITKFYASNQGETHLADSDSGKIMDMMLYGKSEQKQYSGKNLLNYDAWKRVLITRGTAVFEKNSFTLTATENDCYTEPVLGQGFPDDAKIEISEGETITLSWESSANTDGNIYIFPNGVVTDGLVYTNNHNTKTLTYTAARGVKFITFRFGVAHAGDTISYKNIQIEKGSEATAFEPYTGGIPSPNPDYPQEIKSVVNPTVKVCGKNLLNPTFKTNTYSGVALTNNGDGTYTIEGTNNSSGELIFSLVPTVDEQKALYNSLIGKNVKFIVESGSTISGSVGRICFVFYNRTENRYSSEIYNGGNVTVPTGYDLSVVDIHINVGQTVPKTILKPMITTDLTATYDDFEPYHEQTVTIPYTLNAIPVNSGGNITIDGQQYIADYVDVERGKLVRMVSPVAVSDSGYISGKNNSHQVRINKYIKNTTGDKIGIILCDKLRPASAGDVWNGVADNIVSVHNGESNRLTFRCTTKANDTDSALKFIKSCKIYIVLAEPEETDLTSEEIAAFKELATYYPTTNISINSEQLDGYTVFNYPISMKNGWNYVKHQIGDTRDYIYDMDARTQDTDLQAAEAYVNSEYAVALTELEV